MRLWLAAGFVFLACGIGVAEPSTQAPAPVNSALAFKVPALKVQVQRTKEAWPSAATLGVGVWINGSQLEVSDGGIPGTSMQFVAYETLIVVKSSRAGGPLRITVANARHSQVRVRLIVREQS